MHERQATCIDNRGLEASLIRGKRYGIIDDPEAEKRGFFRVIDETGEDYLFYQEQFDEVS